MTEKRDIIVIGASAGGMQALRELCSQLPGDFPGIIFVTWHIAPSSPNLLPNVLRQAAGRNATLARDGEVFRPGGIYVAPADHHLLVMKDHIRLSRGPRENGFRPAVDPMFRTAARAFGSRVVGVILSGGLDDGTEGLMLIKRHGGLAIVQDPTDAVDPSMPRSAIDNVEVDYIVTLQKIPQLLNQLAREPVAGNQSAEEQDMSQSQPDESDKQLQPAHLTGPPTPINCPDCRGSLWRTRDGEVVKYTCYLGHVYTEQSLAANKAQEIEVAMWTALRTLKESVSMYQGMTDRARAAGRTQSAKHFERKMRDAQQQEQIIRSALHSISPELSEISSGGDGDEGEEMLQD